MSKKGILILFVVTVVVIAAAGLIRAPSQNTGQAAEGAYFPGLLDRSNEVAKVIIKDGETATTIVKAGDQWTVVKKGNYPASMDKVRELVIGLARLQRLEGKTRNPDLYAKLELDDISNPGATSKLVQLMSGSDQSMAVLIVGKEKLNQGNSSRRQFYVRSPGDAQAWLVEGSLPDMEGAVAWMEASIFGPDTGQIRAITVSTEGESWTVARESPESEVYTLDAVAADEEVDSQYAINEIARSFSDLTFENVRPVSQVEEGSLNTNVVAETFDGVRIVLALDKEAEQYYGRFKAEYMPPGEPEDSIANNVKQWNALWRSREYALQDYQVESIIVSRQNLIKADSDTATGQ